MERAIAARTEAPTKIVMALFTTIASYILGVILILLLTFGQDAPPQYAHWVRDAIQACGAILLFLSDPKGFLANLRAMAGKDIPIPATLQPVPDMPGMAKITPTEKVETPALVVPTVPAGEVHPAAPVAPVIPTNRVG